MTALPLRKRQERKTKRCPARGWRGRGSLSLSFSSIFMLTNCWLLFESENVALCRRHSQGSSVLSVLLVRPACIFRNPALLLLLRRIHFREWKERQRGTCFVVTVSAAAFFCETQETFLKRKRKAKSVWGERLNSLFKASLSPFFWRGDHSATENRQC